MPVDANLHTTPELALHPRTKPLGVLRSLQFKATVVLVAVILLVTAMAAGHLTKFSVKLAQQDREAHVTSLAATLALASSRDVAVGQTGHLHLLADEAADGDPLVYVVFTDPTGKVLAEARNARYALVVDRVVTSSTDAAPTAGIRVVHPLEDGPSIVSATYPIAPPPDAANQLTGEETGPVGYVLTGVVVDGWLRALLREVDFLVSLGIVVALAAIPLAYLVVHRIVAPIETLTHAIQRFTNGDWETRCPTGRQDEIGRLAEAFNRMADQHRRAHRRTAQLNVELEERVARRTAQLRELASRDPLTGLYNRRYFNDMLQRASAAARRHETNLACLMIDLDDFKQVNDTLGHGVGDELLRLTARTISGELRVEDVAARFGGDEFVVLLPHTTQDNARVLAKRIMVNFRQRLKDRFPGPRPSLTIGVASMDENVGDGVDALVRAADDALYEAKARGKDRIATIGTSEAVARGRS